MNQQVKKTRVLSIIMGPTRTPGACEIYRVTMPLEYLGRLSGWETGWVYFEDLFNEYAVKGPVAFDKILRSADIFVIPRAYAPNESIAQSFKEFFGLIHEYKKKIVYEVDDDYTNDHRIVIEGDAIGIAAQCDAITVTTDYLGKKMSRLTKRPYFVVPNMIDPVVWDNEIGRTEEVKDKILIGLTGSPTHEFDWRVMENPLKEIAEQYDNVRMIFGGFFPDYLRDTKDAIFVPGLPYLQYAQHIKAFDITLCPVDPEDGFNLGKSPIKAIEGMSARRTVLGQPAGSAVIATKNEIYSLAIQDGRNGKLVDHTPESWKKALVELIENQELRNKLQIQAYKDVYKRFNIKTGCMDWARAYYKILSLK